MDNLASAEVPSNAETSSPFTRALLVFTAPSRAFAGMGNGASWWLPFVLLVLVGLGYTATIGARVGWGAVARNNIAQSPKQQARIEKLPAAQQESSMALAGRVTRTISYSFSVVGPLLFGAIVAGVLLGTLNFGFGGHARFGPLFAVYQYAMLPQAIKLLLVILVLALGVSGDAFLFNNPLGSNPAYYTPGVPYPVKSLLSWLDVFTIWEIVLLVIGCSAVAKLSRGKAAAAVVGWTAMCAFIGAGFAFLG